MALIHGVNFSWNPSTIAAMCTAPKCTRVSTFLMHLPMSDDNPRAYYCLDHLLVAATNMHAMQAVRDTWL